MPASYSARMILKAKAPGYLLVLLSQVCRVRCCTSQAYL